MMKTESILHSEVYYDISDNKLRKYKIPSEFITEALKLLRIINSTMKKEIDR